MAEAQTHPRLPQSMRSLARLMIPPAAGWRLKSNGLATSGLFLPLLALVSILISLGLTGIMALMLPDYIVPLLTIQLLSLVVGMALIRLILLRIDRNLFKPLGHLRNWALRMHGGNLSARIPLSNSGEFAKLARDINDLSESLQALSEDMDSQVRKKTEQLAHKTRTLEILYDVAAQINVSRELDELLSRFLHTLKDVLEARAATVRLLTEDGKMRLVASTGLEAGVVQGDDLIPLNRCLCGQAITSGVLLFQSEIRRCSRIVGQPMLPDQDVEMVAVPLQYQGRTLGVYNLLADRHSLLSREDIKGLLTSIGRHLGMAIEKARLDDQARRLSIMQERTNLAHELHDSLAQTLASLRYRVKILDDTLQGDSNPEAHDELMHIKNSLGEAHTELRELIAHFRAPMDEKGLLPTLEDLVNRFRRDTGIILFLQKDCAHANLPASHEMQVIRIVQEALNNIRKHSYAQAVRVMLRCDWEGNYRVLVEDDGVGIKDRVTQGHPGERIGLSIMQERARRIGGELKLESEIGEGTRVMLEFRYPPIGSRNGAPVTAAQLGTTFINVES